MQFRNNHSLSETSLLWRRRRFAQAALRGLSTAAFVCIMLAPNWVMGATRAWDGGGNDGNWTNRFNWDGDNSLAAGDGLVFPAGAARVTVTNNFPANTTFSSIQFSGSGYAVHGNAFTLLNGVVAQHASGSTNTMHTPIQLSAAQSIDVGGAGVRLILNGSVNLGGHVLTVRGAGQVDMTGAMSGTGGVAKTGTVNLVLSGVNTFSGTTTIDGGVVIANSSSAFGAVSAGTVVNNDAVLRLVAGAQIGAEPLTLNSSGLASIPRSALHSDGGSNSWSGAVTLAADALIRVDGGGFLNLMGPIAGNGGLTKDGTNTLILSGGAGSANTYAGDTIVIDGQLLLAKTIPNSTVPGPLTIGDGAGGIASDIVRLLGGSQIANTSSVTIATSGLLDLNGGNEDLGSLSGFGTAQVSVGSGTLMTGIDHSSTTFVGNIVGAGGITKQGNGVFTLASNTGYTGPTLVNGGTLLVLATNASSLQTVNTAGTLGGSGMVGPVNVVGGTLQPGLGVGTLMSSGNLALNSASEIMVDLQGLTPGAGYDQLMVGGNVALGGAALHLSVGFYPKAGDRFTIIDNDGADPVTGTFAGLPAGAAITADGLEFTVTYSGDSGNDVVLALANTALRLNLTALTGGNGNGRFDANECNMLDVVLTNTTGTVVNSISATLVPVSPEVTVVQAVSPFPNAARNSRVTNSIPFQILTSPGFNCGPLVEFNLHVDTGTHGSFSIPLSLQSSPAGACASGSGPCGMTSGRVILGALTANSPSQIQRLRRDLNPSTCQSNKFCPQIFTASGPLRYAAHTFVNGNSNACITISLTAPCPTFSTAYLGQFNPANLCENYLADCGESAAAEVPSTYSFRVPPNATFVVVVNEVFSGALCDYRLEVSGWDAAPTLAISRLVPNKVILSWSSGLLGYRLESTNVLSSTGAASWTPVAGSPVMASGMFRTTNDVVGATRYYRLRKP